jgi:hypothetical protein
MDSICEAERVAETCMCGMKYAAPAPGELGRQWLENPQEQPAKYSFSHGKTDLRAPQPPDTRGHSHGCLDNTREHVKLEERWVGARTAAKSSF